jgi:hypothetical protein
MRGIRSQFTTSPKGYCTRSWTRMERLRPQQTQRSEPVLSHTPSSPASSRVSPLRNRALPVPWAGRRFAWLRGSQRPPRHDSLATVIQSARPPSSINHARPVPNPPRGGATPPGSPAHFRRVLGFGRFLRHSAVFQVGRTSRRNQRYGLDLRIDILPRSETERLIRASRDTGE